MSERALRLILEWLGIHRDEIKQAWNKAAMATTLELLNL